MKKLNAHESLMAFAGWLTSSQPPVTFGSNHNATVAAELVDKFAKSQGLPVIRDDFGDRIRPYPDREQTDA